MYSITVALPDKVVLYYQYKVRSNIIWQNLLKMVDISAKVQKY